MQRSLDNKVMSAPVYIAIAFILWSVTTSVFALGAAAASIWTWLLVAGAIALLSLAVLRVAVANELGVQHRASAPQEARPVAHALARRLGRLDTTLLSLIIVWMIPLVAAFMSGVVKH